MAKVGRNHPCPCGSGRKYKKCCMAKDQAAAAEARAKDLTPELELAARTAAGPGGPFAVTWADDDHLDDDSNRVIDLIHEGRIDEAEAAAHKLLEDYPEVHDGLERLAMVYEKRGDRPQALDYYRRTLQFMDTHDGYDDELKVLLREKIAELQGS